MKPIITTVIEISGLPAKPRLKKTEDEDDTQNQRYYDHLKRNDEGITPVVVKDVGRPSFVM
jgi:hypothetical protein